LGFNLDQLHYVQSLENKLKVDEQKINSRGQIIEDQEEQLKSIGGLQGEHLHATNGMNNIQINAKITLDLIIFRS